MTQLPFFAALDAARAQQLSADQSITRAPDIAVHGHGHSSCCCSPVVYLWCALVPFLRFHVACSVVVLICIAISVDLEPEIVFDSTSSGDSENIFFTTALQR